MKIITIECIKTVIIELDDSHCITVAFLTGIDAVLINSALTRVLVVVVGASPKIALNSVTIVPPRLLDATEFQRGAKTVVLHIN